MRKEDRFTVHTAYQITTLVCLSLVVLAFVFDSPGRIALGYYKIHTSRSVLVTDYIGLGGLGAALLNAGVSGLFFLRLLIAHQQEPTGDIVASLWTTVGFSLFGKNLANTLPILLGIFLYARVRRVEFKILFVPAMLSATLAPLVSEIAFLRPGFSPLRILMATLVGVFVGFIFPEVAKAARSMHHGYCLYNSGIAGGLIATIAVGLLRSSGIEIASERIWDASHTLLLGVYTYLLAAALILFGLVREGLAAAREKLKDLLRENTLGDTDYLARYGDACYINVGVMLILATTTVLLLKIPLNGPILGGIFTVAGFSMAGKHPKSTLPILAGSALATALNYLEQTAPANALAILFSTGLAPIAAKHGALAGLVTGFTHVSLAIFIGQINGGLNLYNNGFAGGFISITLVPAIVFLKEVLLPAKTPAEPSKQR